MAAPIPDLLEALHGTLVRLERRWLPPTPETSVRHGYDPLPPGEFLLPLDAAMKHTSERTFTDLGCGIGTKLAFMHHLGYRVIGVDIHAPYLVAAHELVPEAELHHSDIRDFAEIPAGIVFMYRPMVSEQDEEELERHVLEHMQPGSILMLPARHVELEGAMQTRPFVWRRD